MTDRGPPPPLRWTALRFVVVAAAVFALLAVAVTWTVAPGDRDRRARLQCGTNLLHLTSLFLAERVEHPGAPAHSGPALPLSWRRARTRVRAGDEAVLVCPSDPLAAPLPAGPSPNAYDAVDLARAPRGLCSYAVRDFEASPLDDSPADDVLAVCIHHPGGANVAYANGSVRFLTLAELGVADDDDKTVGPASTSPVLRAVRYGDGSVR